MPDYQTTAPDYHPISDGRLFVLADDHRFTIIEEADPNRYSSVRLSIREAEALVAYLSSELQDRSRQRPIWAPTYIDGA